MHALRSVQTPQSLTVRRRCQARALGHSSKTRTQKRAADLAAREAVLGHSWYAVAESRVVKPDLPHIVDAFDSRIDVSRSAQTGLPVCCSSIGTHPVEGKTTWPCRDALGFVWMFLGGPEHTDLPPIPFERQLSSELESGRWRAVYGHVEIAANHWMVAENVVDTAHVPFVHGATVGDHAAFHSLCVQRSSDALAFTFPIESHPGTASNVKVESVAVMHLPATSLIRFAMPNGWRLATLNSVVPMDDNRTLLRWCQMRNFMTAPCIDPLVKLGMHNILGEDKRVLESLIPHETDIEVSVRADLPALALREMRKDHVQQ